MSKANVAVKEEQTTALSLVSVFEEDASGGFDTMGQEDFALPFLRLLTNVSPEVGEVEGAMPGMIYNSVSSQLYDGKKGILVIPCAIFVSTLNGPLVAVVAAHQSPSTPQRVTS
jgi:hypothetical protein